MHRFRLTSDTVVLSSVNSLVSESFRDAEDFQATEALVATWDSVPPYTEGTTGVRKVTRALTKYEWTKLVYGAVHEYFGMW